MFLCVPSAVAFKNAKQLEEAKDAYLQEAEAHTNNRTYPFATHWIPKLNVSGYGLPFNLHGRVNKVTVYSVCCMKAHPH